MLKILKDKVLAVDETLKDKVLVDVTTNTVSLSAEKQFQLVRCYSDKHH